MAGPEEPGDFWERPEVKEFLFGDAQYVRALFPDRPHEGQAWTDQGYRDRQQIHGVCMRDLHDAFVIGAFQASGLPAEEYPDNLYQLPWSDMDPMAVKNQMLCALEKRMGLYPNLADPAQGKDKDAMIKRLTSALENIHQALELLRPEPETIQAELVDYCKSVYWSAR